MTIYYKVKVGCCDNKMKENIQSAKNGADATEKKARDLTLENLKLVEQTSLVQAKAITLEEQLSKVNKDLETQKSSYES